MKLDLHLHSTASDGSDSPSRIVELAKEKGIDVISLTDHDTVGGVPEALEAGKKLGVKVVRGVELSAFSSYEVHVLGYNIDVNSAALNGKLEELREKRIARAHKILDKLETFNIKLDRSALKNDGSVGRPHIAELLLKGGYVTSVQDAFERYLGKSGAAYVASNRLTPLEAVKTIKAAGGLAVLAHPLVFVNKGVLDDLICGLKPFGLDGIEANYPTHTPEITARLYETARKYRLIATGGTDYHGTIRPVEMGSVEWRIDGYSRKVLKI
mgnify:FL=1